VYEGPNASSVVFQKANGSICCSLPRMMSAMVTRIRLSKSPDSLWLSLSSRAGVLMRVGVACISEEGRGEREFGVAGFPS